MGISRKSRTSRTFCAVMRAASNVYGIGSRSCVYRPSTLPQQRWSESHGVLVRFTSCFNLRRCSRLGLCRSEIHGDSVLHDFVLIEDLIQNVQRPAAVNHEILGDNFKPVHDGFTRENMLIVRSAQANSNPVISKRVKATFRHVLFRSPEE